MGAVDGARVLDLYAGSGALALEALSRGAASAVLVDSSREAAGVARRNARELELSGVVVVQQATDRYVAGRRGGLAPARDTFDLVFCDPPYDVANEALADVLDDLAPAVAAGGTVVVERSARTPEPRWPAGWTMAARDYGETRVYIGGPAEAPEASEPAGGLP